MSNFGLCLALESSGLHEIVRVQELVHGVELLALLVGGGSHNKTTF